MPVHTNNEVAATEQSKEPARPSARNAHSCVASEPITVEMFARPHTYSSATVRHNYLQNMHQGQVAHSGDSVPMGAGSRGLGAAGRGDGAGAVGAGAGAGVGAGAGAGAGAGVLPRRRAEMVLSSRRGLEASK